MPITSTGHTLSETWAVHADSPMPDGEKARTETCYLGWTRAEALTHAEMLAADPTYSDVSLVLRSEGRWMVLPPAPGGGASANPTCTDRTPQGTVAGMATTPARRLPRPAPTPARRLPDILNFKDGTFHVVDDAGRPVDVVLYQGEGEWSALYVDGRLAAYGDHTNVHETLTGILGIRTLYGPDGDDAFHLPDGLEVAETVDQVEEQRARRIEREQRATELEEQAADLAAQAEALRREAAAERAR